MGMKFHPANSADPEWNYEPEKRYYWRIRDGQMEAVTEDTLALQAQEQRAAAEPPRQAMRYPSAYASEEAEIIAMLKLYWFHTPVGLWVNKLTLERVTEEEMEKIIMSGIELRHRMNQGAS